jgi:CheY-like chemotaxis protein
MLKNLNFLTTLCLSLLSLIFFLIIFISSLTSSHHQTLPLPHLPFNLHVTGQAFRIISSLFACGYSFHLFYIKKTKQFFCLLYSLGNLVILTLTLGNCFILISHAIAQHTDSAQNKDADLVQDSSQSSSSASVYPLDALFFNCLLSMFFTFIFRTHRLWMGWTNILLTTISVIISCSLVHWTPSSSSSSLSSSSSYSSSWLILLFIVFTTIAHALLILETHHQAARLFVTFNEVEGTIEQKLTKKNQELLSQLQEKELHHMIGNVAHDLNTPLQALTMELDILEYHVKDCQQHQQDLVHSLVLSSSSSEGPSLTGPVLIPLSARRGLPALTSATTTPPPTTAPSVDHYLELKIQAISQSLASFKYITSFMTMMIHRSTDYNKIRSNIPLLPQYSPTSISEIFTTLEECLVSGGAAAVLIETIPLNIAPIIMTDKVWLLENLLSLLSNAQKFTSDGAIVIRCRLESNITMHEKSIHESNMISGHDALPTLPKRKPSNPAHGYRRPSQPSTSFPPNLSSIPSGVSDGALNNYDVLSRSRTNDEEYILFEVEDTGSGITPKKREGCLINFIDKTERLTFFPTNQSNRAIETGGGTGIGLYVISKRVEAMGGLFGVKSRADHLPGSCFWFLFPYEPDMGSYPQDMSLPHPYHVDSNHSDFSPRHSSSADLNQAGFDSIAEVNSFHTHSRPNSFHTQSRPNSFTIGGGGWGDSDGMKSGGTDVVATFNSALQQQHLSLSQSSPTSTALPPLSRSPFHSAKMTAPSPSSPPPSHSRSRSQSSPPPSARQLPSSSTATAPTGPANHHQQLRSKRILRILLVDDSILIQKAVTRALEKYGYSVDVAHHGYQCLAMIEKNKFLEGGDQQHSEEQQEGENMVSSTTLLPHQQQHQERYDVILMDIQMPQLDGIETTKLIRKYENQLKEPSDPIPPTHQSQPQDQRPKPYFIIGFSANSDRTTYANALEAGMDAFTSKPLSMEKFHLICESHGVL